jgi:GTPase SAR1 family protein
MRFIENKFIENYESTLGVEFGSKIFNVGSTIIKIMTWDTAGQ